MPSTRRRRSSKQEPEISSWNPRRSAGRREPPSVYDIYAPPAQQSPRSSGHQSPRFSKSDGPSYILHNIYAENNESAMLLDTRVKSLLPKELPKILREDAFTIKSAGRKGFGMFASLPVPVGGVILTERPAMLVPASLQLDPEYMSTKDMYSTLFNRLPPMHQTQLMNLSVGGSVIKQSDLFGAIMDVNGIEVKLHAPEIELSPHRGIFLKTSRCNHSCGPNAIWTWDTSSFSLTLVAVRAIRADEEITISYADVTLESPACDRQYHIRSRYGFDCLCEFCHRDPDATQRSDLARQALRQFWETIPSFEAWCLDTSAADDALISPHKHALHLIEQEGLASWYDCGRHVDAIAMCYGALQDTSMFRWWVRLVRDFRIYDQPKQAKVVAKWFQDPTTFPVWGWRKFQLHCNDEGA
ncbi:hypothetical protein BD779DRAFT_1534322 [Infundibulicybe gibba]|nr:hypothetical protein BD779DRAFT_1534322 [Infundibulicybe gibba]